MRCKNCGHEMSDAEFKQARKGEKDKIRFAIKQLEKSKLFAGTGICDDAVDDMIKELKQKFQKEVER